MGETEAARSVEESSTGARLNYFNYFTEIEDAFIRRRGKHLLVSPLDWSLMESWKEMGVPLHVVLRGIERAFDSFEARPRKRSVKSLMYCQEEVEAQFAEWLESQRGASTQKKSTAAVSTGAAETDEGDAELDEGRGLPFPRAVIVAHLKESGAALARAYEERRGRADEAELCEALSRAVSRLEELRGDFERARRPDAERLESSLADLETLIERALRASLSAEVIEEKRAAAEEQLRPYRARMERSTYEQTLDNLLAKSLREDARVPRLSLFYL
jgi:hypothetical protein